MAGTVPHPDLALIIGGRAVRDRVAGLPVLDPGTGEVIGRVPHATAADLDAALAAAAAGFRAWRGVPAHERASILRRAADLVRGRLDAIAAVLTLEQGKTLAEARIEVGAAADILEWSGEEGRRTYGRIVPDRVAGVRQMVLKEPVGPVAAFAPWNFPAVTPARKLGGALGAGCSIILKPAEETPATALALVGALLEAGVPGEAVSVVFGDPAMVSAHLIASTVIRKVSFTGSTPVGKHLARLAADGMKRATMELGGHAPVLVFDDADVDAAADACAAAKFRNAGQVCVSPTRFYVQEGIYDQFVDRFAHAARTLTVGHGLEAASRMGPVATLAFVAAEGDESNSVELTYNWDPETYSEGRNFGHLAFRVDDIYGTCRRLMEKGVTISRPPRDGHMAFVRSPDNISIELLQAGDPLPPTEPWASMPNVGTW